MSDDMNERINALFADLKAKQEGNEAQIEEVLQKLTVALVTAAMSLFARRQVRKALEANGLSEDRAKAIAKALPWAAYSIGANFRTGTNAADKINTLNDTPDPSA